MKKSKAKHFSTNNEGVKAKKLLLSSIFGSAIGTLIFIIILMIFSAISMMISSPHSLLLPLSFFSVYSSAFLAGLISLKRNDSSDALLCGCICGALFMLVLWGMLSIVGYALPSAKSASMPFMLKILIIPSSVLGAFAGMTTPAKKAKRKF